MNDLFWQKLIALKQFSELEFPYALFLTEVESIRVKHALRFVPKKRLVVLADWQDKKVIVKFFISSAAKRHFEREKNNLLQLQRAKIDVPQLLYAGQITNQNIYYLVLEYLEHTTSLNENDLENEQVLQQICRVLTKLHQQQYLHLDLHLNNFLIEQQNIYLIDCGAIKKNYFRLSLSLAQRLKNLALFAAQFKDNTIKQEILKHYLLINLQQVNQAIAQQFNFYIGYWQRKREKNYLKKIFRNSTAYFAQKKWNHYLVCKRAYVATLTHFFANPEQYLQEKKISLLKDGNSSTVLKFHVEQFSIVVKRYNIKNFIHGLRRSIQTTRARKSWYYSHLLLMHDIPVPEPIAIYEQRFFIFSHTSYFLMQDIPGVPLLHYLLDEKQTLEQKQHIISEMKNLFAKLAQLNISHGDTKAMNYLVHENKVYLIDLDGMRQFHSREKFIAAYQADQRRFLKDWQQHPDIWPLFIDFFNVNKN